MKFSKELKQARQNAGLSQAALAQKLGVSRMTIHNWESGKREPPKVPSLSQYQILDMVHLIREGML